MDVKEDLYHALLMEYASGCLDEGQSLIIAAHMALSPAARKTVAQYESVGGAILDDCCGKVAMTKDALARVLDKIDCGDSPSPCVQKSKSTMAYMNAPNCLQTYVESATWTDGKGGYQTISVRTSCHRSKARIYKIDPDTVFRVNTRSPHQLTLVLEGSFHDGRAVYRRGDLIVTNGDAVLHSDAEQGCICAVAQPSVFSVKRFVQQIFIRY